MDWTPDPAGLGCALFGCSTQADAPPWTFVVGPLGATFEVVDVASTGDVFEIFDDNVSLGTTSAAPGDDWCPGDPDACVGTSASYGLFQLAPGMYLITITPVADHQAGQVRAALPHALRPRPLGLPRAAGAVRGDRAPALDP